MQKCITTNLFLGIMVVSPSSVAHGEDFYMQTGGRSVKVIAPSGRSDANPVIPERQGIWFVDDGAKSNADNKTPIQTVNDVKVESNKTKMIPLSRERFTVGEARARLEKAKAQLEKDKDILAKYADEADPNKLDLWRARIVTQEKLIMEKEMALQRIEDRYIQKLRRQRDARLYDDHSRFYNRIGTSDDLSFK